MTSSVCPRDDDLRRDGRDLFGRLAQAEHDFGKPLAQLAMVVDPRETEVLETTARSRSCSTCSAAASGGTWPARTWSSNCCKSAEVMMA